MMEQLLKRGQAIAEERAEAVVGTLLARPLPPGISAERIDTGIMLSGRGLRRRFVTDAAMRTLTRREFNLLQPFSREGGSPVLNKDSFGSGSGLPPARENDISVTRTERIR